MMAICNDDGITEDGFLPSDIHAMQHADNLTYTLVLLLYMLRCEIKLLTYLLFSDHFEETLSSF